MCHPLPSVTAPDFPTCKEYDTGPFRNITLSAPGGQLPISRVHLMSDRNILQVGLEIFEIALVYRKLMLFDEKKRFPKRLQ